MVFKSQVHSMYFYIYLYIWSLFMVNVSKYIPYIETRNELLQVLINGYKWEYIGVITYNPLIRSPLMLTNPSQGRIQVMVETTNS